MIPWLVLGDPRVVVGLLAFSMAALAGASVALAAPPIPWRYWTQRMRTLSRISRLVIGLAAALPLLAMTTLAPASARWGLALIIIGVTVGGAIMVSGTEARRHARQQQRLQTQTIDLARYLHLSLETSVEGDVAILRAYVQAPRPSIDVAQDVVRCALERYQQLARGSVWEALHHEAQTRGVSALTDLTAALVDVADRDRRQIAAVAAHAHQQLSAAFVDQIRQRMQRAELLLTIVLSGSLIFGLLGLILYVMTGGLALLSDLAPLMRPGQP